MTTPMTPDRLEELKKHRELREKFDPTNSEACLRIITDYGDLTDELIREVERLTAIVTVEDVVDSLAEYGAFVICEDWSGHVEDDGRHIASWDDLTSFLEVMKARKP